MSQAETAEVLKERGNDSFRKGNVTVAAQQYTSALQAVQSTTTDDDRLLSATLLSNRAMCKLKLSESPSQNPGELLNDCLDDCTTALGEHLDKLKATSDSTNSLRGKILYRRARANVSLAMNGASTVDREERHLGDATRDLMQLLTFDPKNKDAAKLLNVVRSTHSKMGGGLGRNKISRSLDFLRAVVDGKGPPGEINGEKIDSLKCLRILQGSLAEDVSSSAEDMGRRGGVPLLVGVVHRGIPDESDEVTCRIAALHILSACCSHDPFILKYAGRESLPPNILARVVEEEASQSVNAQGGSADVAVAAMALLVRLIVHWDHRQVVRTFSPKIYEDGTIDRTAKFEEQLVEVDISTICRVAIAAFSWNTQSTSDCKNDGRAPRAALDLISAWTASDLDALDAASDACYAPSDPSKKGSAKRATTHRINQDDIRSMKPRQVAAHKKREADFHRANAQRSMQHVSAFCSEDTGGLDAMLSCAVSTEDHRLRREIGLQIGRMMTLFEEDDDVKKLAAPALGCRNWKVGKEDDSEEEGVSSLTIEELDEEKDEGIYDTNDLKTQMKRGQLTASLLAGKPDVGTWSLKHGWSDGSGVAELKELIASDFPIAMSIASEIVSSASSVESSRPLLATLVSEGTLDDLLIHPDADVRSGAASCAAKIGLASKALSSDDSQVMGLLDVAIELLELEVDASIAPGANESSSKTESTSMDRGIEVMAYLASKTFVKEKIVNGYRPKGSPSERKTALARLVDIACEPNSGDTQMAFGIAGIFNLLAVSIETLRKEAFIGKEITKEQYDQLQSLGKTEEEKDADAAKDDNEGDTPKAVTDRIQKLANANVPRAFVKLLEGATSSATQDKLLEAMGRMATEPSVRGLMIQQGCLTTCLQLDRGEKPNEEEKKLLRRARSCVAKLLVTTNPGILTVSQRLGSVGPLLKLVKDNDALDLMHFEALLSLTNLAGFDDETKNRVVAQKGVPILSYAMFSDHERVRQAATEAMCNMVGNQEFMDHLAKPDNLRVWVAFSLDYEVNFGCARAALGGLAMAVYDINFSKALVASSNFDEFAKALMECGQLELMHRAFALFAGLIEHGGECRDALVNTGLGAFCEAYVTSYQDESKALNDFNFSSQERRLFDVVMGLAKEIARSLR